MNFAPFTTMSFDCYGTLIDWEAGILPVLRGILACHDQTLSDAEILELYGRFEAEAETIPYQKYRDVLRTVVRAIALQLGFDPSPAELNALYESVPSWPPFPDTVEALCQLQTRYRLAIISNIDNDLLAETRKHLDADFAIVITAEQVKSYKPSLRNFELALRKLRVSREQLLHVGQSIYHDIVPAQSLGLATVWVNRKSARPGVGAVLPAQGRPDLEVPDLATLASLAITR